MRTATGDVMVYRVGLRLPSRKGAAAAAKLVERLPPEYWDSKRDPEWIVDLFHGMSKLDTTVLPESKLAQEYVVEKQ